MSNKKELERKIESKELDSLETVLRTPAYVKTVGFKHEESTDEMNVATTNSGDNSKNKTKEQKSSNPNTPQSQQKQQKKEDNAQNQQQSKMSKEERKAQFQKQLEEKRKQQQEKVSSTPKEVPKKEKSDSKSNIQPSTTPKDTKPNPQLSTTPKDTKLSPQPSTTPKDIPTKEVPKKEKFDSKSNPQPSTTPKDTKPNSQLSITPKDASSLPSTSPSDREISKKPAPKPVPAVKQFDAHKVKGVSTAKRGSLFGHLPQYESSFSTRLNVGFSSSNEIHSSIVEFGLKITSGEITGSNARCVGMLLAFKKVISDFNSPNDNLFRDFDIKPLVQFLVNCRPLSISMGNAINYLKVAIAETKKMNSSEAKNHLILMIDKFINERIVIADEAISSAAESKITDGDVVLTYSRSHVVELAFKKAHDSGKKFKIIIVDSKPKKEGKLLLKRLVKYGINCTYVLINALSYVMKEVSKVFVGAYTMMANGNLLSRVGTALTAMVAHSYHVPFIVCCETYKFTERIQLESISFNELGNPEDLLENNIDEEEENESSISDPSAPPKKTLKNWKEMTNLTLLNLIYDLTPTEFIAMVITEVGTVPPTSVPVIIREFFKYEAQ